MEYIIALAEEEDLPEILALQKKAFTVLADIWDRYDIEPLLETPERLRDEFRNNTILKYVSRGRIVGSVRGGVNERGNCYIGKLSVDPEVQNKGIGRKLMQAIEDRFSDCPAFELFTSATTPNTRHLYESLGYRLVGRPGGDPYTVFYEKENKPKNIE